MIPLAVFFALMTVLAGIDLYQKRLPNLIVIPAALIACVWLKTYNPTITAFLLGCLIYKKDMLAGGDVKLFIMVTAFLGWIGLLALPITILFIKLYRKIRGNYAPLPVAPFMFFVSILTAITENCIKQLR